MFNKVCIVILIFLGSNITYGQKSTDKVDREKALRLLESSMSQTMEEVKGLSSEQLNFKPSEDSWSIAECVEHLTLAENNFQSMLSSSMTTEAAPEKRSELKFSDGEVYNMITDRSSKFKTSPPMEPTDSFEDFKTTLKTFKKERQETIKNLKQNKQDLRTHYSELPFGLIDAYQMYLFDAGHTMRHNEQILEIKANPNFPTS